jgi:hypothetical protein
MKKIVDGKLFGKKYFIVAKSFPRGLVFLVEIFLLQNHFLLNFLDEKLFG